MTRRPEEARSQDILLIEAARRKRLLKLVCGEGPPDILTRRAGHVGADPGDARARMLDTSLGMLFAEAGSTLAPGNLLHALNEAPVVADVPDRVFWRAATLPVLANPNTDWQHSLGIVFHYDTYMPPIDPDDVGSGLLVTGEEEIGLAFDTGKIRAYRTVRAYADMRALPESEVQVYKVRTRDIDTFTGAIKGMMLPARDVATTPMELHGVDLSGFDPYFGDALEGEK